MKKKRDKQSLLYALAAMLAFGLLYAATFRGQAQEWRQVQMVAFGDSVFTDLGGLEAVPERLSKRLGISVFNASMGGTCAAKLESLRKLSYGRESLSLAGLTKAIRARDFSVQQSAKIRDNNTETFPGIIDGLETIDFEHVEVVLIQKGVNDYHAGTAIEDPDAPYDEHTFLGAIRSAVADLRKVNPDIRILLVTPTFVWYTYSGETCEQIDYGGGLLKDYVEAELSLAEELGVEAVDLYHDFYPHEKPEDWERYTMDGLHPNEAGRELIAQAIVDVLESGK